MRLLLFRYVESAQKNVENLSRCHLAQYNAQTGNPRFERDIVVAQLIGEQRHVRRANQSATVSGR
jgi:hypothetical protein